MKDQFNTLFLENKPAINSGIKWWQYTVVVVLLLVFFFGGIILGAQSQNPITQISLSAIGKVKNKDSASQFLNKDVDFKLFWQVWDIVKEKYLRRASTTESQLFYGALAGSVASLGDPYSIFMNPETNKKFTQELAGNFEGIGAEIGIKNNQLMIVSPLPESPAEKAGLKPQDRILAIDRKDTQSMALDLAVSLIRGKKGTKVKLIVQSVGKTNNREVEITRDVITVKSVSWKKLDDFAYIQVNHFNDDTKDLFTKTAKEVILANPKGIILDLRNNPGGYLDTAIFMAGYWVKSGQAVVGEQFADPSQKDMYNSSGNAELAKYPTVILVNGGSASASEIVSGALKDHNLAKLIGQKTFGKGTVQTLEKLPDGSSVKITIAKWLTPNGTSIEEQGITPDVLVEIKEEDVTAGRDPQLDKAKEILIGKK